MPDSVVARRSILRLENASRVFRTGEVDVVALHDATLDVAPGEFLVILGPSGSGKSTLLNLIGGMDRPTSGRVWHRERELSSLDDSQLTLYRRDTVGFVFQFYNLVPTLTAYENVLVATELAEHPIDPAEALRMVGLERRAEHFPAQLSGGEQQRVAIARAIAKRPELLLADEPTGALDLEMSRTVLTLIQNLNREQGLTTVVITHNAAISQIATRMIRIVSGSVEESRINEHVVSANDVTW